VVILKVVEKPIEVIAWFDKNGTVHPTKFRVIEADETIEVIRIDKIIKQYKERLAGIETIVFTCQSLINGIEKFYEIKYKIVTCIWVLYKI
jgi:hypothetical protein